MKRVKKVHVSYKQTTERLMDYVDSLRTEELYSHNTCTGNMIISMFRKNLSIIDECKKRGCGKVFSADGLWKLGYPIW